MRVTTSELSDHVSLQAENLLWYWHKWTPVNIQWHLEDVSKAKLPTRTSTEAMNFSSISKDHSMNITTGGMRKLVWFQSLNKETELARSKETLTVTHLGIGW